MFKKSIFTALIFSLGIICGNFCLPKMEKNIKNSVCEPEYLELEEFARLANRSIYVINGCMPNKLAPYVRYINGHKRIHKNGLKLFKTEG